MTTLRRFVAGQHEQVAAKAAPESVVRSESTEAPAPVEEPAAAAIPDVAPLFDVKAAAIGVPEPPPPASPAVEARQGALHRLKSSPSSETAPPRRAVTDTLVLLKSLMPVLRAALVFPGPDAPTPEFGKAVRHMAEAVAQLTEVIARDSDPLELDGRWARKSLQEVAAELVAHHWVSTVIAHGGLSSHDLPEIPVERFTTAVREVLQLPAAMEAPGGKESFDLSTDGSIRLSFLKAFAPLAVEIERYGEVVNRRLEERLVDAEALQLAVGQLLMDQALVAQSALLGEADASDDERRMTLQACLAHAGALLLAVWEPTRGDALGTLADTSSLDEGRHALKGVAFQYGFPVTAFRQRAIDAVSRLVGTTQAALVLVRPPQDAVRQGGE